MIIGGGENGNFSYGGRGQKIALFYVLKKSLHRGMGGSKTTLTYSKLSTDWSGWTTDQKLNYYMKNTYKNYFLF